MSENDAIETELAGSCPVCNGPIEGMQTICASCRAELERSTMAVRAADFPPPSVAAPGAAAPERVPAASLMDMRMETATDEAPDLLELAPLDQFVRSSPAAARPRLAPVPVEVDKPSSALHPEGRWKVAILAIALTMLAGLLGAAIWSFVIPDVASPEPAATGSPTSSVNKPTP